MPTWRTLGSTHIPQLADSMLMTLLIWQESYASCFHGYLHNSNELIRGETKITLVLWQEIGIILIC
jgi:hypothetical protein